MDLLKAHERLRSSSVIFKSIWSIPGPSSYNPRKTELALSLSPTPHLVMHLFYALASFLLLGSMWPCDSSSYWVCSRWCGLQKTKLWYEAETLDIGFYFGLTKETLGLSFLYFFCGGMDRGGTLGTQRSASIFTPQIHLATPQSPMCRSLECLSCDLWKSLISAGNQCGHLFQESFCWSLYTHT